MNWKSRRFFLATFGCRVNQAESRYLREGLAFYGWQEVREGEEPELAIINSCAVTAKAEREVKKKIRSLKKLWPKVFLTAAGCAADYWKKEKIKIEGIDLLVGNEEKDKLAIILQKRQDYGSRQRARQTDHSFGIGKIGARGGFKYIRSGRALVKIQDGCNYFCRYCVVPCLRSRLWSKSPEEVVGEIQDLEGRGVVEVVLAGINLDLYKRGLADLLEKILEETTIKRIRFGSMSLGALTKEVVALYRREYERDGLKTRLCRHLHLPLQSGSNSVLKLMGRRYSVAEFESKVGELKEIPGFMVTTDLLVGFPGETKKNFEETISLIEKTGFLRGHIFRFSLRKGSGLEKKGGLWKLVGGEELRRRARVLRKLFLKMRQKELTRIKGEKLAVLFEGRDQKGLLSGYTDNFIRVGLDLGDDMIGKIKVIDF